MRTFYQSVFFACLSCVSLKGAEPSRIDLLETRVCALTQSNVEGSVGGKNPTTWSEKQKQGIYFSGDFLYWRAGMDGLEYAVSSASSIDLSTPEFNLKEGRLKSIDFAWDPGWRAALGYHFNYDQWDLKGEWTHLNAQSRSSAHAPDEGSLSGTWIPIIFGRGLCSKAKARWHLNYDVADIELGRSFYLTKALSLRPFFGPRAAWIDQKIQLRYDDVGLDPISSTIADLDLRGKNDFSGGGMRLGFDMNWRIGSHFSFYAQGSGSMLYGVFDTKAFCNADGNAVSCSAWSQIPSESIAEQLGSGFWLAV